LFLLAGGLALVRGQVPLGLNSPSGFIGTPEQSGDLVRFQRNIPGDSKTMQFAADEIATWTENGQQVVFLRGQVLVQQAVVQMRCQQAVVWVDIPGYKARGIWHAEVYGEGDVVVDGSSEVRQGNRALLNLNTRGEVKLQSVRAKVAQQNVSGDPLVQRGLALRRQLMPAPTVSAPAPVTPTLMPVSWPGPQPPAPGPPGQGGLVVPPWNGVQQTRYQQAQQNETGPIPGVVPPGGGMPMPGNPGTPALPSPNSGPPPTPLPPPSQQSRQPAPKEPPDTPPREYSVSPRNSALFDIKQEKLPNGEQAIIVTGGIILIVRNAPNIGLVDMEADRLVIFSKNLDTRQLVDNINTPGNDKTNERTLNPGGQPSNDLEFYLSGNVELRQRVGKDARTIKADELYYDVKRNVALAYRVEMSFRPPRLNENVGLRAPELRQLDATHFEAFDAEVFASKLPSDPGLKVYVQRVELEERVVPKLSLLGQPLYDRKTGAPLQDHISWTQAYNAWFEVEDVPFFYSPYVVGDARDPLGPIEGLHAGYSQIFGVEAGLDLNMYDLLHMQPYDGTRWILTPDYFSARGPNLATTFDYAARNLYGTDARVEGLFRGTVIYDHGTDNLGGFRVPDYEPDAFRGRALWRQGVYDIPYGFTVQTQFAYLSDRNYLEQYYKSEYEGDLPYNTYAYVKQQRDNWAWTAWANYRMRPWVWETQWLPKGDFYLLGEDFFNLFTYSTHASAGWAFLRPSSDPLPPVSPTDQYNKTFRGDWMQELSLPFSLGALRLVPYGKLDLTAYSRDLNGDSIGRVIGGGGLRGSIPFTRIFPDVDSELFNLDGINHKIVLGTNYYAVKSNEPYSIFPQLDRNNDDVSDQSVRDIRHQYPFFYPNNANNLINNPLYDPQTVAIRRLVDNRIDTQDSIQEVQMSIDQRWQTKRGYPGAEHIVDWMTLDLSATYFPDPQQNFEHPWAFLEYNWIWNLGDRTALVSNGWVDPFENGGRLFNVGVFFNRTDRTNFYLGYTSIFPLQSESITATVTYILSPKYAITAGTTYDFGSVPFETFSLMLTRMGTDVAISVGFNYNSLQGSISAVVLAIPNLVPPTARQFSGLGLGAGSQLSGM
jgi:hypothetical protein